MPTIRPTPQALPVALPGLAVASYGTSTAMPIGISNDRKTLYGSPNSGTSGTATTLYQSVDDGATWTSVRVFTENVMALLETDDGEALVTTIGGSSTPGYVYKSTGWTASHTAATWTKVLTSTSGNGVFFRPYWGSGHFCSFGNDKILPNSSRVGVVSEYGNQTTSTAQSGYATKVYLTQDYGATWTTALDLAVRYPGVFPLHIHSAAYDPYWDRIWVLYGDTPADGATNADVLYSDDRGATWNTLPLNGDWIGSGFNFQSTSIAVLRDCILMGSDNSPGFIRLARKGYRKVGDLQVLGVVATHTGSQMIATSAHRNRLQNGAPLLMALQAQNATVSSSIRVSLDEGATLVRLWSDEALHSGTNILGVFGPTWSGSVVASVGQSGTVNWLLRGELILPDPYMLDGTGTVTGDGTTTVFSFPHGLPAAPSTYLAWPEKPVTGAYTVTATATAVVVTFATAPVNASVIPFQWRAGA